MLQGKSCMCHRNDSTGLDATHSRCGLFCTTSVMMFSMNSLYSTGSWFQGDEPSRRAKARPARAGRRRSCLDAAFPVEGSGRPLRSRSILLRCPAGRGYLSVHLRSGLQPPCLRFAVADTTQDSIRSCLAQALPPSHATELNALARRNPLRTRLYSSRSTTPWRDRNIC
jgi:hypothetical protein